MQTQAAGTNIYPSTEANTLETNTSGVTWSAVFAGAVAAAALSLILLILGIGLGLSSVSPWSYTSSKEIGTSTIAWLAFMQLASSAIGGYLAGRLRVKWSNVHTDEVYFRDTAHGLLAWAVAALISAVVLAGLGDAILSRSTKAGTDVTQASVASAVGKDTTNGLHITPNPVEYYSDMLFRSDPGSPATNNWVTRREVNNIFITDMPAGKLSQSDQNYLTRIVARRSGLSQNDAGQWVNEVYSLYMQNYAITLVAAKEKADAARKAGAYAALWMFVAFLLGAFIASLSATFGGAQRDSVPALVHN
ncbi:MAG: hypothetical protein ACYCSS_08195 [Sulfuriferula sp.]